MKSFCVLEDSQTKVATTAFVTNQIGTTTGIPVVEFLNLNDPDDNDDFDSGFYEFDSQY